MSSSDWATLLLAIGALITSGVTLWKARKTVPSEARSLDADTSTKYMQIASDAADHVIEVNERLDKLEVRMVIVEHNFRIAMDYVQTLLDGIDRLVHQLKASNLTPVWTPPALPKLRDTGELKRPKEDK